MTAAAPQLADDPGRLARVVDLVRELAQARGEASRARTEIARIEGELAELVRDDTSTPAPAPAAGALKPGPARPRQERVGYPGSHSPRGAAVDAAPEPEPARARKGERQQQVVALAKQGLGAAEIAARLGVPSNIISMALWRARKDGLLPKARTP